MGLSQWNLIYKTTGHIPLLTARPHNCLNEYACVYVRENRNWMVQHHKWIFFWSVTTKYVCGLGFLVGTHIPFPKQQHIWYTWMHLNLNTVLDISIHAVICFMYIICCIFPEFSMHFIWARKKTEEKIWSNSRHLFSIDFSSKGLSVLGKHQPIRMKGSLDGNML